MQQFMRFMTETEIKGQVGSSRCPVSLMSSNTRLEIVKPLNVNIACELVTKRVMSNSELNEIRS